MESLLAWNNEPAPVIVRLNTLASHPLDPAKEDQLISLGMERYYPLAGSLPREWVESGQVYIQDPSTRIAVELLDPQPGETVLDACAAPGGKSSLVAAAMNNEGQLLCTDSSEKRIPRLIENLARQQITNTATERFDWTEPAPQMWKSKFDRILLDVPCSNSGVMRRRAVQPERSWLLLRAIGERHRRAVRREAVAAIEQADACLHGSLRGDRCRRVEVFERLVPCRCVFERFVPCRLSVTSCTAARLHLQSRELRGCELELGVGVETVSYTHLTLPTNREV